MSASAESIRHKYRYLSSSDVVLGDTIRVDLQSDRSCETTFSFCGGVRQPALFADFLLCLSCIVRANFAGRGQTLLDPVVTCGRSKLRFEGFSGCCGLYSHAVFDAALFDTPLESYGTTNIDINDQLRNGLSRIRSEDTMELSLNRGGMEVTIDERTIVEKKVQLPLRWIRGFCEVQAILTRVEHQLTVHGRDMLRFLRSLPRNSGKQQPVWAVEAGRGIRASRKPVGRAAPIIGTDRLRLLEPLLSKHDCRVFIGHSPNEMISTWYLDAGKCHLLLVLSPGIYRGFSGEGQVLDQLTDNSWQNVIHAVRAQLNWKQLIDPIAVAGHLQLRVDEVNSALSALAASGVVGFDLQQQAYFYRVLPFDSGLVESLQPRLKAARRIVEEGKIALHQQVDADESQWIVQSSDLSHRVTISRRGNTCTCIWFSKYKNDRGPCKHILAANICAGKET